MATVTFRRTADVDSIPIVDGSLVFDLSRNKIYMDNGNTRIQYGGDTDLISSVSSATGQNAFSATATVATFLQKTSVINTKANALAVTQNNIPLGCLAFKEMLGTNNYSGIGDGTVSGALTNLNSRTNTSQSGVNDLVSQLKASGTSFYFDYKDGKWGWNSSPARGAGTFHPFRVAVEPILLGLTTDDFNMGNLSGTVSSDGYIIFNAFGYIDNVDSRPTETLTVGGTSYTIGGNSNRDAGFRIIPVSAGTSYSISVNWTGPTSIRWQYYASAFLARN